MKFETPQTPEASMKPENSIRGKIEMPHIKPILEMLEETFKGEKISAAAVEDILYRILEEDLNNAAIYNSEARKASFPWTKVDSAEVAKKLFAQYAGAGLKEIFPATPEDKSRKTFLFTSINQFQGTGGGNILTFSEEIFHEIIKDLPKAFQDLKEGKEPHHNEIYNLASPTNTFGSVSEEFVDSLKDGAFREFGGLYAEFVGRELQGRDDKTSVYFHGISEGGSFAAETASHLVLADTVTQEDGSNSGKPNLRVRIDTPPGPSEMSPLQKKWQIPVGFGAEMGLMFARDKYMRQVMGGDKKYVGEVEKYLAERGLLKHESTEEEELKKHGISEVVENLRRGVPLPENVRIDREVIGMYDMLMYSPVFNKRVKTHKEELNQSMDGRSLGENFISEENDRRRKAGIRMTHVAPNMRRSELNRWKRAIESLENLKK